MTTIAIKGSSSSKSLFPNLNNGKHTCLMPKESKRKVKIKGSSSPKYVTSDEEFASDDDDSLPSGMSKKITTKRLMKEFVLRDELLEKQEDLLVQERKKAIMNSRSS